MSPQCRVARTAQAALLAVLLASLGAVATTRTAAAAFQVKSVFQFGPAQVGVAFSDSLDIASALRAANYALAPQAGAPARGIASVALQENHRMVVLTTTDALPQSAGYAVAITGVKSRHGDPLAGPNCAFVTAAETITGIADVHANINNLIGQTITIIGEVFIREASVTGTPSGYIQDGTARGLNVFGTPLYTPLDTLGTVVKVTGQAALYFTTVELQSITSAVSIASNVPPLGPKVLNVTQASSAAWEGTYIQVTGTMTTTPSASGSNHYNYPAADGGVSFWFRVRNSVGVNPAAFAAGDVVTGAGAGANFQGVYQATVGVPGDFYKGEGPGDQTPPVLVSASGEGGGAGITLTFSEPVGAGASVPANYVVAPTAGSPIAVSNASAMGSTVTLTLAAPLVAATEYTVGVSNVQDAAGNAVPDGAAIVFTAATPVPFQVAAAFPFGADYVGVAFTRPVNASQATQASNYSFAPPLALAGATLQANGRTVILHTTAPLPASTTFALTVTGVTSATGDALLSPGPFSVVTGSETVTNIAAIQANPSAYSGQSVTFIGQVTIPVGSRGGAPNGYVEDGSGHGVNLYGGTIQGPVNQLGSVARITGTVTPYFTTTEITSYTATGLASGLPHLGARVLSVAECNSSNWEGTYIETSAEITDIAASGTSSVNYTATDGGASVTFRVGTGLGFLPGQFAVGDRVTGRGAGGSFQSSFQINVGNLQDFSLAGAGGPDTTAPRVVSASGTDGSTLVVVAFSEPLRSNEATLTGSYRVYPTSSPASLIAVRSIVMAANGRSVTVDLASTLGGAVSYTVEVTGVADLSGNVVAPGAAVAFVAASAIPFHARLAVPAVTLVRGMSRQGELMPVTLSGAPDSKALCRVFDIQGHLVRVLYDGKLTGTPRRSVTWDGRDERFEHVPAGLYVCHLLITDVNGSTSEDRAPIVVALRLQ
ncbi:MAG TPA: Ig-like domain-containing protein [Candidatus Saccharimonadaceae bacterium]|jgi:hypothetical protein|nr:Ig-like domain-containing protein [Candidatus Saccharimonadaceae bacterium]